MNKVKKHHVMSFELFEIDLEVLRTHAWLAAESGSLSGRSIKKFELESRYIITQLPRLYDYFMVENGKYLIDHGVRTSSKNHRKWIFDLRLPVEVAEQYYQLQHRHGRAWVLNALINIYQHRQEKIENRERSELEGSFLNYRYPFHVTDWNFSYLGCPEQGMCKGYHIDLQEPIVQTVQKYLRLDEIEE